jgi:hypothetical protein
MATVLEQVLDRLDAVLQASVPAGTKVHRDLADALSRADAPAVNVLAEDATVTPMGDDMDQHQVFIDLVFYVREEPGAMAAEALHRAVHPAIVNDATLAALCEGRRLVDYSFQREEADITSTHKRARYRFTYLVHSNAL